MWIKLAVYLPIYRTNQRPDVEAPIVDEYGKHRTLSKKEELLQTELDRIRGSATFRFGNLFVRSLEQPWRFFFLPFTIPLLLFSIIKKGKAHKLTEQTDIGRDCVVFFSSKSNRCLHFDRCEAMIQELSGLNTQIIHVTTEPRGVNSTNSFANSYFFPGRSDLPNMSPRDWNYKCESFLDTIFDVFTPMTFIFDGDYPFRGLINAMDKRGYMNRFWVRESASNYKISSLPLDSFEKFDAIIHPSFAKPSDADTNVGSVGSLFCNPIISKISDEKQRDWFRIKHIPDNGRLVFFDVGKVSPNSLKIANELLKQDDVYLLIRPNLKERSLVDHPKSIVSHGLNYSDSMYFCDSVVLNPDHFCIHTAFFLKKPILSIVKEELVMQFLKEEMGADTLPLLYINSEDDDDAIAATIERFTSKELQLQLIERMEQFNVQSGASQLAELLIEYHN